MKFLKKELRLMEEIEEDTVNWQHSTTIPLFPNLKIRKKERTIENWKHEVYLWEEDKYIHFSSGAKMFLYICALLHDNDRSKMLQDIIKNRHLQQLREFKRFDYGQLSQELGRSRSACYTMVHNVKMFVDNCSQDIRKLNYVKESKEVKQCIKEK